MTTINFFQKTAKNKSTAAPLMGFPGVQLTETNLKTNLFNPSVQAKSLMQISKLSGVDVIFPMMDLSIEAGALGLTVTYPDMESPSVENHPINSSKDLAAFKNIDITKDCRVWSAVETIRILKSEQSKPICAYICGPFSLTGLLIGTTKIFMSLYDTPDDIKKIIDFAANLEIAYAKLLQEAGADAVCMLEPTAMMMSPNDFVNFVSAPIRKIVESLEIPSALHICGDSTHLVEAMCDTGISALSLDAPVDIPAVMPKVPENICVIGNIDPANLMLRGTPDEVTAKVTDLKAKMQEYGNYIMSTGCDLPPDTPLANIEAFANAVKS
ncbi:MAG: uroporphyrinogen decarboxylase (URO-D) [Lentisphaerae bacterium]|nr:uroporphyrinogen decarboxylase (URO-D) [Lentisphaerota bacterium]MCP4103796.1 uroporphyrinogen decarboxylase (URO-D) [Lentisphaerota bacterium]